MQIINSELVADLRAANEKIQLLQTQNKELDHKLAAQLNQGTLRTQEQHNQPNTTLLIGNSLLRDMKTTDRQKLEITTIPGGTTTMIKEKLESSQKSMKQFKKIIIVAGTNDTPKQEQSSQDIADNIIDLADIALSMCESVTISSIPPRLDNGPALLKLENTNLLLKDLCSRNTKITYVDNEATFRLADKSPNDAYFLPDGLHLSQKGTERFIKNLDISATYQRRQRNIFYGTNSQMNDTTRFNKPNFSNKQEPPPFPRSWNQGLPNKASSTFPRQQNMNWSYSPTYQPWQQTKLHWSPTYPSYQQYPYQAEPQNPYLNMNSANYGTDLNNRLDHQQQGYSYS